MAETPGGNMTGVVFAGFGLVLAGPLAAIGIAIAVTALVMLWRWMVAEGWTGKDPKRVDKQNRLYYNKGEEYNRRKNAEKEDI